MRSALRPVEVIDQRHAGGHLRVSWHPEKRLLNVSQWRNGVCVATTPLDLADVPALVTLLVSALAEGAAEGEAPRPTVTSLRRDARSLATSWLRSALAPVGRRLRTRRRPQAGAPGAPVVDLASLTHRGTPLPDPTLADDAGPDRGDGG